MTSRVCACLVMSIVVGWLCRSPVLDALQHDADPEFVTVRSLDGTKLDEVIPALQLPSRRLAFPRLLPQASPFERITLLNSEADPAHLEMVALDPTGAELRRVPLPRLSPMATYSFATIDLLGPELAEQVSIVRVVSDRGILGWQTVDLPDGDLVSLAALTVTSQEWLFPILARHGGRELSTLVSVFNPTDAVTSVRLEAFDAAHDSLGIVDAPVVAPGASYTARTAEIGGSIPAGAASVTVMADQPVSGYLVIGVRGGMGATASLGIPAEDHTTVGFELVGAPDGSTLAISPVTVTAQRRDRMMDPRLTAMAWKRPLSIARSETDSVVRPTVLPPVPDYYNKVDVDVDWNRNGTVEDEADDPNEHKAVDFLAANGALTLVNCDSDIGKDGETFRRDMDDTKISNAADQADMAPINLELERDLERDEELWLVITNVDAGEGNAWANVMDPKEKGDDQVLVGHLKKEQRLNDLVLNSGEVLFRDGKAASYRGRFLIEGLRFAKEVSIRLEIRKNGEVTNSDEVRVLNTPWLANNNTQPLAKPATWKVPGNLVNAHSYQFAQAHGADRVYAGELGEFVQDSAEWGFQVRRQNPTHASRTMITALRLFTRNEDKHPMTTFLNEWVGVYGYFDGDEPYFAQKDGDAGGNLECLPPSDQHPFGRLLYGDTMSDTLRAFLDRQKAQVKGGAIVLEISKIRLAHVDEMVAIVPTAGGYVVAMPDWKLATDLLRTDTKKTRHHVSVLDANNKKLDTYADVLKFLTDTVDGKKLDAEFRTTMDALQKAVADRGATVLELPGMFLMTDGGGRAGDRQRAFPRNIANSQPTVAGKLVVSEPPKQGQGRDEQESMFLTEWNKLLKAKGVDAEPENMTPAWRQGGEAHCASNVIREPIKK